jgi:hypothetical protein
MGYAHTASKELQSQRPDTRQLPDGTIGYVPNTTQRLQDRPVNTTEKRPDPGRVVHVFEYYDAWRRYLQDAVPPVCTLVVDATNDWWFTGAQPCGGRIADHRRKILKHAPNTTIGEAGIAQSHLEGFDCICDHAGIEMPKRLQVFLVDASFNIHIAPFGSISI